MPKLSASSIGTYEKCPKKYHYQYIEKPDIVQKDWSHLEFGKCAHKVLELFHEDLLKNVREPNEYAEIMRQSFKTGLAEFSMDILKDSLPELKNVLQVYLTKMQQTGLPQVISNEMNFEFYVDTHLVRGFIDRIDLVGPGEYKVVDYKTNKNPKYLTNFQLLLYALAIKEKFTDIKKISGAYVLLKHNCDLIEYDFTEQDYEDTLTRIKLIGKTIDTSLEWEKKPSILCNWCDYQGICQGNWTS